MRKHKLIWKVSKYRKDKRTGPVQSLERSEYIKRLFHEAEKITRGV